MRQIFIFTFWWFNFLFLFIAPLHVKCQHKTEEINNIDNLIPYTHKSAAWSDRYSNVGITWDSPENGGLQKLEHFVGHRGATITNQLLTWQLAVDGKKRPLEFIDRNFRPDKIIEINKTKDVELKIIASYPLTNAIAVEFIITNTSSKKHDVQISFNSCANDSLLYWTGKYTPGNIVPLENANWGSWSTIFSHRAHGLNRKWVESYVSGMTQDTPIELVCLTDLSPKTFAIVPKATSKHTLVMAFGKNRASADKRYKAGIKNIESGWTSVDETKRWDRIFKNAPPLPEKYKGKLAYERLYKHAIAGLQTLFIQGEGGYTGNKRALHTTKRGLANSFFWDTQISCVGAREFNTEACQEAISCFTDNVGPRGSMPGTICDSHHAGEGQAPVMAWGVWSVYQRSKDVEWLKDIYPTLCGYINFWFKFHQSENGFCQYFNAGQIADNDARFDQIMEGKYNEPLYGFESPDLNAFLVMEMNCLSRLAHELQLTDDATMWKNKANDLGQRIVDAMYFPDEGMFYDIVEGTHQKYSGVKTPNMFLPLWAGVPLEKDEVDKIIKNHMLNPSEFFRKYPFPSLSYDDPKHNPTSYWRGRIWPHVVYWMVQTLWRQGYYQEAELTADNLLNMLLEGKWISENYESENGEMIGQPEYNWSQSTAIQLLLERYKEELP